MGNTCVYTLLARGSLQPIYAIHMKLENQIAEIAEAYHALLTRWAPMNNGHFKSVVTVSITNKPLPLLLVGNAQSNAQDGDCIAVLNPSKELASKLAPGVGYIFGSLQEMAAGNCDCMVYLFLEHYKENKRRILGTYEAKTPREVEVTANSFGQWSHIV